MSQWDGEAVKELRGAVTRYCQLSDERKRGRARAWLAAEGYRPTSAAHRA